MTVSIEFRPDGRFLDEMVPQIRKTLSQSAAAIATFAAARCAVGPGTGPVGEGNDTGPGPVKASVHTRETIRASVGGSGRETYGIVRAGGAAIFLEFPTKSHWIYPRHPKEALYWEGVAHPVAKVFHPGTTAQPFLAPALLDFGRLLS